MKKKSVKRNKLGNVPDYKININTYLQLAKTLDFSKMPEGIPEGHEVAMEAAEDNWSIYHESESIKDVVDLYFEKLQLVLQAQAPTKPEPQFTVTKARLIPTSTGYRAEEVKEVAEKPPYHDIEEARKYVQMAQDHPSMKASVAEAIERSHKMGAFSIINKRKLLQELNPQTGKTYEQYMSELQEVRTQEALDHLRNGWEKDSAINPSAKGELKLWYGTIKRRIEANNEARSGKQKQFVDYEKKDWIAALDATSSKDEVVSLQRQIDQAAKAGRLSISEFKAVINHAVTRKKSLHTGSNLTYAQWVKEVTAADKITPHTSIDRVRKLDALLNRSWDGNKVQVKIRPGANNGSYTVNVVDDGIRIHDYTTVDIQKILESTAKTQPAPKAKKPKKAKDPKAKKAKAVRNKAPIALHDHFTPEEAVIKRFVAMDGKEKAQKQVKALLDTVDKLIVERKTRKTGHYAETIKMVQQMLTKAYKYMLDEKLNLLKINLSSDTLALLKKFAKQSKVYPTVALLKRFIPMMGTAPDKEKAKKLLQDITKAMKAGNVLKSDTYYGYLSEAVDGLMDYVHNGHKSIVLNNPGLSGLGALPEFAGLGCPGKECACDQKPAAGLAGVKKKSPEQQVKMPDSLRKIFSQIDQPGIDTKANSFRLNGAIGKLLGDIERKEFAIALRGDKGAGKTSFMYQLKDAFADKGFNVASFTLEIDKQSDLVQRMTTKYIKPQNRKRVQAASIAPGGITTIREAAKYFDVVCVDSWTKLGVSQDEFDKLRKDFPDTFFIIIFQSTTAGTARGGSMAEYDAGIVIQVDVPGVAFCEKNRYASGESLGLKYLVFEQKLENQHG